MNNIIEAFNAGVMAERINCEKGNFDEPMEVMFDKWRDGDYEPEPEEYYYSEGDLSEKTARRNHRIRTGGDDFL
jgi:hypothetical protein